MSSEVQSCVAGLLSPNNLKECSAFIFKGCGFKKNSSFGTTANTKLLTQCDNLEDLNPQQHCCGNLKYFTVPAYLKHFIGFEF
jgi:hypothetical protein